MAGGLLDWFELARDSVLEREAWTTFIDLHQRFHKKSHPTLTVVGWFRLN